MDGDCEPGNRIHNGINFDFMFARCSQLYLFFILVSVSALRFSEGVEQPVSGRRLTSSQSVPKMPEKVWTDGRAGRKVRCITRYNENLEGKPCSYYTLQMSSHPPCSRHWSWRFWQPVVTEERQCLRGVHSVTEACTRCTTASMQEIIT
jgi:hypothetical protein